MSSPIGTLGAPSKIASPHKAFVMDISLRILHAQCPPCGEEQAKRENLDEDMTGMEMGAAGLLQKQAEVRPVAARVNRRACSWYAGGGISSGK